MVKKGKRKDPEVLPPNFDDMSKREKQIMEEVQYKKQLYCKSYGD